MVFRQTVSLPEFGVQVTLPSTWMVNHSPGETHFVARDAATGAVLAGEISVADASKPLAADIGRIVEQQRARLGPERKSSRGVMALGLLSAEWVELAYEGLGNPLRIKTIALRRGNRVLTLTCNGGNQAQTACAAAITARSDEQQFGNSKTYGRASALQRNDGWSAGERRAGGSDGALAQIPSDTRPIAVVCAKGGSSSFVAEVLRDAGRDARNVAGGMASYSDHLQPRRVSLVEAYAGQLEIWQVNRRARVGEGVRGDVHDAL